MNIYILSLIRIPKRKTLDHISKYWTNYHLIACDQPIDHN